MAWNDELKCARCGHFADVHGIEEMDSGCLARTDDGGCDCPLTWERIEDRAIRRMTAGLEF